MLLKISHIHDAHEPRYLVLADDRSYVISGGPSDVRLADSTVSSPHARLTLSKGTIVIQDLGSFFGTYVDEEPIGAQPTTIELAQWIRVGETLLQLTPGERIPRNHSSRRDEVRGPTPDETAFLSALQANPADDETRLVYADWLESQGYTIGARYIRLELDGDVDLKHSELVGRTVEITNAKWRSIVCRGRIGGCPQERCPARWHRLQPGSRSRTCSACRRDVHYCATSSDVIACGREHALVVFDAALSRRDGAHDYMHGVHGVDDALASCHFDGAAGVETLFRTWQDDGPGTLDRDLPDE